MRLLPRSVSARVVAMLATLGLVLGAATPAAAAELPPPAFEAAVFWPSPKLGIVARDGTPPTGSPHFPVYAVPAGGYAPECSWSTNNVEVRSHWGFTGTITLELLDLPTGVTSQTSGSLTITGPTAYAQTSPDTAFILAAASSAPLGDATVTLRATSGGVVRTRELPIRVVDQLPSCDETQPMGTNPDRPGGVSIRTATLDGQQLAVEATSCCTPEPRMPWPWAAWVVDEATGEVIGEPTPIPSGNYGVRFTGSFAVVEPPQVIRVLVGPHGGWNRATVTPG